MATIKVSDEMAAMVKKFAEKKKITEQEAGDKLLGTGFSRLGALARYAKAQSEGKPAPKKAKAKGPIARKAKKVKAETVEQSAAAAS